ncbi:MAG: TIGR00153 family protein [Myxococcales bacterium]|nr:TIGR00153 family protein [Myxococcales bacterium]MCB9709466.1 TIGR00153 family protein [Myxococcales bacterium]
MRIPLAGLFVRSPLLQLGELMNRVVECCERVPDLFEKLIQNDQAGVESLAVEISRLEAKADEFKNRVRSHMPIRLFLPVDRRDILSLISKMDAVADSAEDAGVLLTLRTMTVPPEIHTSLRSLIKHVMDCVYCAQRITHQLDPLLEAGFKGRPADNVMTMIDELHRLEHEADIVQIQNARALFELEHDMPPTALFMWTKILNKVGDMANHAENVGDLFRLFIAH